MAKAIEEYYVDRELLDKFIKHSGLNATQISKKLGINRQEFSRMRNGHQIPKQSTRTALAQLLRCPEDLLFPKIGNILYAIRFQKFHDVREAVLRNPKDVNRSDIHGYTPIMWAIKLRYPKEFRYLVESGADLLAHNNEKENILIIAAKEGNELFVEKILACKKKVVETLLFECDVAGDNALMWGARNGFLSVCKRIVDYVLENCPDRKADILEKSNIKGKTALLKAAGYDDPEMVKYLIEIGANLAVCDRSKRPRTALDIALENNNERVVGILEAAGGGGGTPFSSKVPPNMQNG